MYVWVPESLLSFHTMCVPQVSVLVLCYLAECVVEL